MATIEQLAYKIVADTSGFTQGVMATRTELRAARAITDQVMTSHERLEKSLDGVQALYDKGAITLETRNRALAQLRDAATKAAAAEDRLGNAARHGNTSQAGLMHSHLSSLPIIRDVNTSFAALPGPIMAAAAALTVVKLGFDAAAAAGRWVVSTVAESTEKVMQLSREAEALGVSSSSLAGWRDAAADLSGAVDGQLDGAIMKMNRLIAEAVHGGGAAKETLAELGLSAKDLAAGGTEQAFYAIVDAMNKVENPMERARVATDLFGKTGAGMLNTFAAGSAGLRASVSAAEDIGLALNEVDTANVFAMGMAFDDLADVAEGFGNQITAVVAPGVAALAQSLLAATAEGEPLRAVMDSTVVVVGLLAENMGSVADVGAVMFGPAIVAGGLLIGQLDAVAQGVAALDRMAASVKGGVNEDLQRGAERLHDLTQNTINAGLQLTAQGQQGVFSQRFADARAEMASAEPKARQLGGAMLEIADAGEKAGKKTAETAAKVKDWGAVAARIHDEVRTPAEKYQDRLDELNDAVRSGELAWEDYERAVAKAAGELQRLDAVKKSATDTTRTAAVTRDSQAALDASAKAIAAQQRGEEAARVAALPRVAPPQQAQALANQLPRITIDQGQVQTVTLELQAAFDAMDKSIAGKLRGEDQRQAAAAAASKKTDAPGAAVQERLLKTQLDKQSEANAHLARLVEELSGGVVDIREVNLR